MHSSDNVLEVVDVPLLLSMIMITPMAIATVVAARKPKTPSIILRGTVFEEKIPFEALSIGDKKDSEGLHSIDPSVFSVTS